MLIVISVLIFGCDSVGNLNGYYEDQYIRPDINVLRFDSNFLFEEYVRADLKSYYSRGTYLLKGKKMFLNYDSIYTDSILIIDKEVGNSDSVDIRLLLYDDTILDTNLYIYSGSDSGIYFSIAGNNWWKSIEFYEIPLQVDIRAHRGENNVIALRLFDGLKRFMYDIKIETTNCNYLKVEYFPSKSVMIFNDNNNEKITLKKVDSNLIEFKHSRYGLIQGYSKIPAP